MAAEGVTHSLRISADVDLVAPLIVREIPAGRAAAAERYFFDAGYFRSVLAFADSWLLLAVEPGGETVAGSLLARSDGLLHYYLSGSADQQLRDSPMKNIVAAICDLGEELGLPVNLGGGFAPGDALEEFKRGFAN